MSLQRGINLRVLAEKMGQCSGAEVRGICTEAGELLGTSRIVTHLITVSGMYALRERRQHVTQEDFEFAIAKVSGRSSIATGIPLNVTFEQVLKKNQEGNTSVNKLFS